MTTSTDTRVALHHKVFAPNEELALAGFVAGYSGLTREAYMLDLRQYVAVVCRTTLRVVRSASCGHRSLRTAPRER